MGYLIAQILIYLVLAALIGFWLAWVIRDARLGRRIEELENELWRSREQLASASASDAAPAPNPMMPATAAPAPPPASEPATSPATTSTAPRAVAERKSLPERLAELEEATPPQPEPAAAAKTEPPPAARVDKVAAPEDSHPAATQSVPATEDSQPAPVEPPAKGEGDDLKRIKGIGPKIEQTLHSLGIYHFYQIAAFTPANVEWVNEHLRFKGRIEREKWIPQAKELSQ